MVFSRKSILSCFLVLIILVSFMPVVSFAQAGGDPTLSAANPRVQPPASETTSNGSCLDLGGIHLTQCMAKLANIALSFFSFVLGLSALLLDFVLNYTVVEIKNHLPTEAIQSTWFTIRDIINLSFIFILLYAAIKTILGFESPEIVIKNIVLAAIFINFSMFFTRVMIDASNSVTIYLYDKVTQPVVATSGLSDADASLSSRAKSLTSMYINPLKITTLYAPRNGDDGFEPINDRSVLQAGILGSFTLALVAFVFLAISFMFALRYAVIMLLLVFSPLGFVSKDLPMIGEYKEKWWDALKSQLLFPPLFMIMTWITLKIINSPNIFASSDFRAALGTGGDLPSNAGMSAIFSFVIIIVLIIISLITSLETASKGSGALSGLYKKTTKWAGSAMFGTMGGVGRWTLGAGANAIANNRALQAATSSENKNIASRWASRMALGVADAGKTASFDMRGGPFGSILKESNIDAGQATGKGGFETARKETRESFSMAGTEAAKKREERARKASNSTSVLAGMNVNPNELDALRKKDPATRTTDEERRLNELETVVEPMELAMARMSDKEIEAMVEGNRALLNSQMFAQQISVQQLEALNKSDKFSETEKDQLKDKRFATIKSELAGAGPLTKQTSDRIAGLSDKEIEMMSPTLLKDKRVIVSLKNSHMEAIGKSTKFTQSQRSEMNSIRKEVISAKILSDPTQIQTMNVKEVAKLDKSVLTNPVVMDQISRKMYSRLEKEVEDLGVLQTLDQHISHGEAIAEDKEVMGKIQGEALKENEERTKQITEENKKAERRQAEAILEDKERERRLAEEARMTAQKTADQAQANIDREPKKLI